MERAFQYSSTRGRTAWSAPFRRGLGRLRRRWRRRRAGAGRARRAARVHAPRDLSGCHFGKSPFVRPNAFDPSSGPGGPQWTAVGRTSSGRTVRGIHRSSPTRSPSPHAWATAPCRASIGSSATPKNGRLLAAWHTSIGPTFSCQSWKQPGSEVPERERVLARLDAEGDGQAHDQALARSQGGQPVARAGRCPRRTPWFRSGRRARGPRTAPPTALVREDEQVDVEDVPHRTVSVSWPRSSVRRAASELQAAVAVPRSVRAQDVAAADLARRSCPAARRPRGPRSTGARARRVLADRSSRDSG